MAGSGVDAQSLNDSEPFRLRTSAGFNDWLYASRASIAFTTYQAAKIFFLGLSQDRQLTVSERTLPRCMGLAVSPDGGSLVVATHHEIVRFNNVLPPRAEHEGADALFAPHVSWITGEVDAHDGGFGADQRPIFVNTRFSCLAAVSERYSFRPG